MQCCKWRVTLLVAFVASLDALPMDADTSSSWSTTSTAAGERGIEFPNTAFIPGDLTEQLNVDEFFSLWLFFLDDDMSTSGKILRFSEVLWNSLQFIFAGLFPFSFWGFFWNCHVQIWWIRFFLNGANFTNMISSMRSNLIIWLT